MDRPLSTRWISYSAHRVQRGCLFNRGHWIVDRIVGCAWGSQLLRICDTRRDISYSPKPNRSMITGMWTLRLCIFVCLALRAVCQQFDIAIVNGRVMDPESGLDQIRSIGV